MSICTDNFDEIDEAFANSFENDFIEEDDYMSIDKKFTINSPVGTKMKLDDNTDVLKLPAGVLVRTDKSSWSSGGVSVAVHTIYLTDEQYFGASISLEKRA